MIGLRGTELAGDSRSAARSLFGDWSIDTFGMKYFYLTNAMHPAIRRCTVVLCGEEARLHLNIDRSKIYLHCEYYLISVLCAFTISVCHRLFWSTSSFKLTYM